MLTPEQKRYFETFGFLVLRRVFETREIDELRRESERLLAANREGRPFDGSRRQAMIPFFEYSPRLRDFIEDDRIWALGEDLLGPEFHLNATEGNLHVGDTRWHGGTAEPDRLPSIKIAFYLEPTTRDTGAIRLIPGSNNPEYRRYIQVLYEQGEDPSVEPLGVSAPDLPCHVAETEPGDLVVFPESTWHGAFGGAPGRSQHAINFTKNPQNEEERAWLRSNYEGWLYSLHPVPELIESGRPRLRKLVAPQVEMGFGPPQPTPIFA